MGWIRDDPGATGPRIAEDGEFRIAEDGRTRIVDIETVWLIDALPTDRSQKRIVESDPWRFIEQDHTVRIVKRGGRPTWVIDSKPPAVWSTDDA